ncbi:hypothetical protein LGQ03_07335 [Loktanella sp. TSTF-M6]|uniref:Major facilitator superfamily (MFS) profile domain-containing protein n=1 Tax=Loktanella gaetbuli TaxID=2881335 RepID=A0ABS8BTZ5_9RHOB|nr:hypothetical protein [Loktanella gaetbuli]MCB5199049.1 hypothetical protein [Loktanella gaetbuli]
MSVDTAIAILATAGACLLIVVIAAVIAGFSRGDGYLPIFAVAGIAGWAVILTAIFN